MGVTVLDVAHNISPCRDCLTLHISKRAEKKKGCSEYNIEKEETVGCTQF